VELEERVPSGRREGSGNEELAVLGAPLRGSLRVLRRGGEVVGLRAQVLLHVPVGRREPDEVQIGEGGDGHVDPLLALVGGDGCSFFGHGHVFS
jgi:hypothetical protein